MRVRVKLGEKPPLPKGRTAAEFDVAGRRFSFCKEREGKVVSNVSNPRSCLNPPSPPWVPLLFHLLRFLERLQSEPFTALAFVVICYRRRRRRHGKLLQFQHDPPISAPLPSSPFPIHIRCGSSVNCFACELFSASTPYSSPPVPGPSLYFE